MYRRLGQRMLDLVLTVPLLIIVSPLLLILVWLVRMKLGAPVLFRQQRPGLDGRPFIMLKFRTMTNACDPAGKLLPDDERLTAFGHFLRSTSLDELPELLNVLKGEMSLVGPRPLLMEYLARYTPTQMQRHAVRPGITGWAQIQGRNLLAWEEKFAHDLWYVQHQSLWLDLKIIGLTLGKLFTREGISQPGHVTAAKFIGDQQI